MLKTQNYNELKTCCFAIMKYQMSQIIYIYFAYYLTVALMTIFMLF